MSQLRRCGRWGSRTEGQPTTVSLDFSGPVEPTGFYQNELKPALRANGLPASTAARTNDDGSVVPVGVCLHDYADLPVVPTVGERCCRPG